MGTVYIPAVGGEAYTINGTQAAADTYVNGSRFYRRRWLAASPDDRASALVDATRYMEDLPWKAGVVPSTTTAIVEATYLLAANFILSPGATGGMNGGQVNQGAVRDAQDTTRRVSFHYSSRAERAATDPVAALPRDVRAKIASYLGRAINFAPKTTGLTGESAFTEDTKLDLIE